MAGVMTTVILSLSLSFASANSGSTSAAAPPYAPIQALGLADNDVAWAADGVNLYVSSDQGRDWRTVTPPIFTGQSVSTRLDAMVAVGPNDLWLPVTDVIGLVPFGQSQDGSDRGVGIERSTDGGQSWTFSALPGCLQGCGGNLSLSFVDAEHGFAALGPAQVSPSLLFATDDGGVTWTKVGRIPDLEGVEIGGTQMEFTDPLDGWVVTGPTFSANGQPSSPGGALYRTTDGGVSWSAPPGLPVAGQYGLPTFFGTRTGVALSNPGAAKGLSTSVLVTHDGGSTWARHPIPRIPGVGTYQPPGLGGRFVALGPSNWVIDVGSALYRTTDAGHRWVRSVPAPKSGPGTVVAAYFSSAQNGLALALPPGCGNPVNARFADCGTTVATATTDGGRSWRALNP
jgi:photosystem II stability/assembly factor-like uncharacterized protein